MLFLLNSILCKAQYAFSGYINPEDSKSPVYLSLVEDYRKMSGAYSEQILTKTLADSTGYFQFTGDQLANQNRIYRIHIDKCSDSSNEVNHFNGDCSDSEAFLFIAKNTDTLSLPFSFGKQIFCAVESNNPGASAFLKIDSLKQDMKFAYGEFRSEANRKLNNKKWFRTLQEFGQNLEEPLAELYIYNYLSNRSSDLHSYYVQDLKTNTYYDALLDRLVSQYPNASYTKQYKGELESDRYMLGFNDGGKLNSYTYWLFGLLLLSLGLNVWLIYYQLKKQKNRSIALKSNLSKQETIVLEQLLLDKSNKEIAETLFLSVSTIKSHTNNIYKKLNVQSREEAKSLFIN
ncbi:response regulator transcription factor [Winogradskyella sp. DF17]|uniref:Response regulator transcription factor n=1 Tax=Winogradskyella pelagia TaxID=2819984 RepID=A0ABS3T3H1_9FLAO|nr:response regulator transcription factor [Winogradskyella sp. DF17]